VRDASEEQLILGRALQALREQAGLTQEQLAARIGVHATYVSQVERGRRGVRWHTVMRFLDALEDDLRELAVAIEEQAQG
jgi:transcriptional regulator with XRE-family HTH domain